MSFPKYSEYAESAVSWLKQVPPHWKVLPLKVVATCNDEVLPESTNPDRTINYVEISDVNVAEGVRNFTTMSFSDAPSRARRLVRNGDILISTVRTYLKAITSVRNHSDDLIASTGFAVIRPNTKYVEPSYLSKVAIADGFIGEIISRSVGVSYPAINASDIVNLQFPLPPKSEQTQIARFLDHETAKIDALIAEQKRLIKLLQEKRQAVISHAVTKGLDPNVPMKDSGLEWLGEVPAHWGVKPIKYMATKKGALFIDGDWIESKDISSDGIRYLTTGNVGEGKYKEQGSGFISEATFNKLNCTEVFPGDILISRLNNPIGRACIIPDLSLRVVTSVDNVVFRPDSQFDKLFLTYLFSSKEYFRHTSDLARGATMQRISRSLLGNIRVVTPGYSEQIQISHFLDNETNRLDELSKQANRTIELMQERRSALISAAVTGKIDVRDWQPPADESAFDEDVQKAGMEASA